MFWGEPANNCSEMLLAEGFDGWVSETPANKISDKILAGHFISRDIVIFWLSPRGARHHRSSYLNVPRVPLSFRFIQSLIANHQEERPPGAGPKTPVVQHFKVL